eukprot:323929_1
MLTMVSTLLYHLLIFSAMNAIYAINITTVMNNQYENQTINCIPNEPCYILCQHSSSCALATINCPTNFPCIVQCSQSSACDSAQINAHDSSVFRLLDCATGTWTCVGMTLFFPPNDNGKKKAFLSDFDRGLSAGNLNEKSLQFYAINGWHDIDITPGSGFTFNNHAGFMYCTPNYIHSCEFNSNAWSCANITDICNNQPSSSPKPTQIPINNPTYSPINNPTISPINNPTYSPINNPTISPINNPTYSPINNPTISPINNPTYLPINNPTYSPITDPTTAPPDNPTSIP